MKTEIKPMNNTLAVSTGFHHIAVKCHEFDRSVKFYRSIGGTVVLQWGEEGERACMMDIGGGARIELFDGGGETEAAPETSVIHFCLQVESSNFFYDRAMEAGAESKLEPTDYVINGKEGDLPIRISFIYGPDREVIEFFQYR